MMGMSTFLVVVDESKEFPAALRFAARRAKQEDGRVALLYVVEPSGIETWGGVERAMDDEAFERGRQIVSMHAQYAKEQTGKDPLVFYKKGELRSTLLKLIDEEKDITILVLGAQTGEGAHNPLVQYLSCDKGLRKLKIPMTIVPDVTKPSVDEKG